MSAQPSVPTSAPSSQVQVEDSKAVRRCCTWRVARALFFSGLVNACVLGLLMWFSNFRGLRGNRYEFVEQKGAKIPIGGEVRLYFVGGSNVAWQTWPDQLHAYLWKLSYIVPEGNYTLANLDLASDAAPVCDDVSEFDFLKTPRIAHPGWGSWGFAYDSTEDCTAAPYHGEASGVHPFRKIAGHEVSCLNGWACKPGKPESNQMVKPSEVALDAQDANVVLLSTWVNDFKQQFCDYKCFNGTQLDPMNITDITVENLSRMIRAIHRVNPSALVLVMALYPDAKGPKVVPETLGEIAAINARVAEGVHKEPNAAFVDFELPGGTDIFQTKHAGHPNCRGDRLMATRVLEVLFERRVLGRSLALPRGDEAETCLRAEHCSSITSRACCQGAARCRIGARGRCEDYGPGEQ